ncbi:MAG: (d)CMP kinase [Hyphomicrobiales bacterium]|jgi:cytidylate kinase|nr:(d)CMP kinase [Hyphomicrobiales bacterium]
MRKMIIAIDGPAASGKGTIGKRIAEYLKLPYLDSGSLYRLVAHNIIENNIDPYDIDNIVKQTREINFSTQRLLGVRANEVSNIASIISQYQEIRDHLIDYQRNFATHGAVVDGRDIGTIIFPNADFKFYITASLDERAERRYLQYKIDNIKIDRNIIKNDINNRDQRDINRKVAPLKCAKDALEIDTTKMKIDDVIDFIVKYIHKGMKIR